LDISANGQNLATTVRVTLYYLERRGEKILSYKLLWEYRRSLIQMHVAGERQPIKHTQTLSHVSRIGVAWTPKSPEKHPQLDLRPFLKNLINGSLIFKISEETPRTLPVKLPIMVNV
jgi:hypothetical protein